MKPVASGLLGAVHGDVGAGQQGFQVLAVVGAGHDADARGAVQAVVLDHEVGLVQILQQPLRHQVGALRRCFREQHAEFVAAEPTDGVGIAHVAPDQQRNFRQKPVAGGMAEGVVDDLELVHVDEQQAHWPLITHRVLDPLAEFGVEPPAVHEPGQRVLVGELNELVLGALLLVGELRQTPGHAVEGLRHLAEFVVSRSRNLVAEIAGGERRRAALELVDRAHQIVSVQQREQCAHRQQDGADEQALGQDIAPGGGDFVHRETELDASMRHPLHHDRRRAVEHTIVHIGVTRIRMERAAQRRRVAALGEHASLAIDDAHVGDAGLAQHVGHLLVQVREIERQHRVLAARRQHLAGGLRPLHQLARRRRHQNVRADPDEQQQQACLDQQDAEDRLVTQRQGHKI